ncbi:ABC-type nitrate/sulfonate/bicarbonate transport systems, periplasmic components [hydrothermal vent metagenome]|uniref:ABC-type nitrate/sulfonate/bicarbonate transport systems, periplasmic components n=1 Tax=hydrothermal vent metagenome TaxID=652676 RepID=A0A3B1BK67_9ZZZZ
MWHKKFFSLELGVLPVRYLLWPIIWLAALGCAHYYLNFESTERVVVRMGYMPVITNFSAPILDYASVNTTGTRFKALKFASFAEMAEALRNRQIDAAFIIAPLAIVLRQQKSDVNIVLIGNRHESSFVTRSDLNINEFSQLEGRTIAVPMRFSGHNLSALGLVKQHNMEGKIKIVEMNPPDMAFALESGSLDAYYVGEPFAAKTLQTGKADLLFYVEDIQPGFICNLVIVNKSFIDQHPERVQLFVESAARAGMWVANNKPEAASIAAKYWNSDVGLIQYAMNTPENRIIYDQFIPKQDQIQEISNAMLEFGLSESSVIDGLIDDSFAISANLENIATIESIITE